MYVSKSFIAPIDIAQSLRQLLQNGSVLITDTSTQIAATNLDRSSLYLLNLGNDDVWVSCDADAEFEKGMLLGRNGGSMLIDATASTTGPVNGICRGNKFSDIENPAI